MAEVKIPIPQLDLADFCPRHPIRKLVIFGSVLRDDFGPNSDVDFLVEFDPDPILGLIRLAEMKLELSNLIQRQADLRTLKDLSRYSRDEVLQTAVVQYDETR
jgi:predicted nucleotidyltransferase